MYEIWDAEWWKAASYLVYRGVAVTAGIHVIGILESDKGSGPPVEMMVLDKSEQEVYLIHHRVMNINLDLTIKYSSGSRHVICMVSFADDLPAAREWTIVDDIDCVAALGPKHAMHAHRSMARVQMASAYHMQHLLILLLYGSYSFRNGLNRRPPVVRAVDHRTSTGTALRLPLVYAPSFPSVSCSAMRTFTGFMRRNRLESMYAAWSLRLTCDAISPIKSVSFSEKPETSGKISKVVFWLLFLPSPPRLLPMHILAHAYTRRLPANIYPVPVRSCFFTTEQPFSIPQLSS
ncbi:hypothetical protein EDD18DRAFT_1333978 [Armillaria luteobubalina]|uniref:Uncharacterized protein n=1 Tax=Armillaria luteobubalina TaxID=153913 RepID=A0AA39UU24_9AGAR|nr:hypothetical protein EDD18DRAFT_1333978 [Armillaria luteobubalina]